MEISVITALVFLACSVGFAVVTEKNKNRDPNFLDWTRILICGVFFSSFVMYIPVWYGFLSSQAKSGIKHLVETVLLSLHNAMRLFVLDGDFSFVVQNTEKNGIVTYVYYAFFVILYIVAPMLTFGFVLSFFKNASANIRLLLCRNTDVYVFSELNEKSLVLAKSIREKAVSEGRKSIAIFTDVFESREEKQYEFVYETKKIKAICFKKDIVSIDFTKSYYRFASVNFFVIGEVSNENIGQALKIAEKYKYMENTNMYVFSTKVESEILMANLFNLEGEKGRDVRMKIRKVDDVYSLITKNLYEKGYEKIFKSAVEDENGIKWINALVVGMGQHGTEMTKALSWLCQMDGYRLRVNCVDAAENAKDKFTACCSGLMDEKFNHHYDIEGDAGYSIDIYSGVDVETQSFFDLVDGFPQTTYVFVALGDDDKNANAAHRLFSFFARKGYNPEIQAIIYSKEKKEALNSIRTYRKEIYDIDFIGDITTSYSESVILGSELEDKAKARHMCWGDEASFWQYDYNRKSSYASAIHRKLKIQCGIPGIDKKLEDRTPAQRDAIRELEHKRWNAYMRSEGYVYGEKRNDLAKVHPLMVPFGELSEEQKKKDDD